MTQNVLHFDGKKWHKWEKGWITGSLDHPRQCYKTLSSVQPMIPSAPGKACYCFALCGIAQVCVPILAIQTPLPCATQISVRMVSLVPCVHHESSLPNSLFSLVAYASIRDPSALSASALSAYSDCLTWAYFIVAPPRALGRN